MYAPKYLIVGERKGCGEDFNVVDTKKGSYRSRAKPGTVLELSGEGGGFRWLMGWDEGREVEGCLCMYYMYAYVAL